MSGPVEPHSPPTIVDFKITSDKQLSGKIGQSTEQNLRLSSTTFAKLDNSMPIGIARSPRSTHDKNERKQKAKKQETIEINNHYQLWKEMKWNATHHIPKQLELLSLRSTCKKCIAAATISSTGAAALDLDHHPPPTTNNNNNYNKKYNTQQQQYNTTTATPIDRYAETLCLDKSEHRHWYIH